MSEGKFPSISGRGLIGVGAAIILTIGTGMAGCPAYDVYRAEKAGEAERAQADQNRQIAIAQARAKAESAHYEADAEVTRAIGVAKANEIIGKSLQGNEAYLRYLWINGLEQNKNAVIYVQRKATCLFWNPAVCYICQHLQQWALMIKKVIKCRKGLAVPPMLRELALEPKSFRKIGYAGSSLPRPLTCVPTAARTGHAAI